MFNFNLVNEGLMDSDLSDFAFRLLYFIANNKDLKGTGKLEIFDDDMAEQFHCCRRKIQYATSELEQRGYITKKYLKQVGNKKPLLIKVGARFCTESPKVDAKICIEDNSECKNLPKVDAKICTLNNSNLNNSTSTGTFTNFSDTKPKQISVDFKWLNEQLAVLNRTEDRNEYDTTDNAIGSYIQTVKDQLSEKQKPIFKDILDRWFKISDQRDNLFNSMSADATT